MVSPVVQEDGRKRRTGEQRVDPTPTTVATTPAAALEQARDVEERNRSAFVRAAQELRDNPDLQRLTARLNELEQREREWMQSRAKVAEAEVAAGTLSVPGVRPQNARQMTRSQLAGAAMQSLSNDSSLDSSDWADLGQAMSQRAAIAARTGGAAGPRGGGLADMGATGGGVDGAANVINLSSIPGAPATTGNAEADILAILREKELLNNQSAPFVVFYQDKYYRVVPSREGGEPQVVAIAGEDGGVEAVRGGATRTYYARLMEIMRQSEGEGVQVIDLNKPAPRHQR